MVEVYQLFTVIVSLVVVKLFHWIYQWRNPKTNGKLPPGSMGFPIIGETFEFMKPHDALQFSTFVKERTLRHGPLFRTSLFGTKVIISTDTELNMEIAKMNHGPGITKSILRLFGETNLFVQSKESHKHVRNLTFQLLGSQGLRLRMMQDIDLLARKYMEEGARKGCLDVKETASEILIECLAKKVMGEMEPDAAKELALCWKYFPSGWFRFSFNLPGMGIYKMMKVINESLRVTSTIPTILRTTDHEFQVGDHIIPAGWTFMGYAGVHFNPEKYDDPLAFNPWRWKGKDLGAIISKTYIPFGAGPRLCVGADFAKLQMAIFIHHLSRYRWSMKTETTVLRSFILMFPGGSNVQISEDTEVGDSAGY